MTLTPSSLRADVSRRCGKGYAQQGEKCHKGAGATVQQSKPKKKDNTERNALIAGTLVGGAVLAGAIASRRGRRAGQATKPPPKIPKKPPAAPQSDPAAVAERRKKATEMADRVVQSTRERAAAMQTHKKAGGLATATPEDAFAKHAEYNFGAKKVSYDKENNFFLGKTDNGSYVGLTQTPSGNWVQTEVRRSSATSKEAEVLFDITNTRGGKATAPSTPADQAAEQKAVLTNMTQTFSQGTKGLADDFELFADTQDPKIAKFYKNFGFQVEQDGSTFNLFTTAGDLRKYLQGRSGPARIGRSDSASRRCGKGYIPVGRKCRKAGEVALAGAGIAAAGLTAAALLSRRSPRGRSVSRPHPSNDLPNNPGPSLLPGGPPPLGLLRQAPPRMGRTRRMEQNVQTLERQAEQRVATTAREEIRRIAQVGNTMGALGEATGARVKLTARNLRLRAEAARRRFEPGYRSTRAAQPQPPAQLPESGEQAFEIPFNPSVDVPPEAIPIDPRTGQPRRRKSRGFG